jgi:hypothetical protein
MDGWVKTQAHSCQSRVNRSEDSVSILVLMDGWVKTQSGSYLAI